MRAGYLKKFQFSAKQNFSSGQTPVWQIEQNARFGLSGSECSLKARFL